MIGLQTELETAFLQESTINNNLNTYKNLKLGVYSCNKGLRFLAFIFFCLRSTSRREKSVFFVLNNTHSVRVDGRRSRFCNSVHVYARVTQECFKTTYQVCVATSTLWCPKLYWSSRSLGVHKEACSLFWPLIQKIPATNCCFQRSLGGSASQWCSCPGLTNWWSSVGVAWQQGYRIAAVVVEGGCVLTKHRRRENMQLHRIRKQHRVYRRSSYDPFRYLTCSAKDAINHMHSGEDSGDSDIKAQLFSYFFNQKAWSIIHLPKIKKEVSMPPLLHLWGNSEREGHNSVISCSCSICAPQLQVSVAFEQLSVSNLNVALHTVYPLYCQVFGERQSLLPAQYGITSSTNVSELKTCFLLFLL